MEETRAYVQGLLSEYSPTNPSNDFEAIKGALKSDYYTFDVLCRSIHGSIVAEPLLLTLDFHAILKDAERLNVIEDLERWIGFIPESKATFPREQWFDKWASAALAHKCAKVLSKLVRIGQAMLIANLDGWDANEHCSLWVELVTRQLHPKFADTLLMSFLRRKRRTESGFDDRQIILRTFLCGLEKTFCEDWIAGILLNRRIIKPPDDLFLLLTSMEELSSRFFERVAAVWADEGFVLTSNSQRHAQVTAVVRFSLVRHKDKILQGSIEALIVQGVSTHLNSNIAEKRYLGMVVGEDFSRLRNDDPNNRLDFGIDRESMDDPYAVFLSTLEELPMNDAPARSTAEKQSNGTIDINNKKGVIRIDQIDDLSSSLRWPWPAPPENLFANEDNQDNDINDDDCSLEPYDLTDDAMDGLVTIPKQLSQIPSMLTSDQYENVQTALVHLADLIRINRSRQDTHRRAARLTWTLLELENRFGLADFDANRSRALVSLIVSSPRMAGPAVARAIYSKEISIGVRLVALNSLIDGVKLLAEGGFSEDDDIVEEGHDEAKAQQMEGKDLIGKVIRKSKKLEQKPRKAGRKNLFAPLAYEYFFTPLCRRVAQFENEPILLCKVVHALSLFVEKAKHAGGEAERMAEELVNLCPWINSRKEAEVRRTALFALLAVASVNRDYLNDWQEWLIRTAQDDPDNISRDLAKRILMALG